MSRAPPAQIIKNWKFCGQKTLHLFNVLFSSTCMKAACLPIECRTLEQFMPRHSVTSPVSSIPNFTSSSITRFLRSPCPPLTYTAVVNCDSCPSSPTCSIKSIATPVMVLPDVPSIAQPHARSFIMVWNASKVRQAAIVPRDDMSLEGIIIATRQRD